MSKNRCGGITYSLIVMFVRVFMLFLDGGLDDIFIASVASLGSGFGYPAVGNLNMLFGALVLASFATAIAILVIAPQLDEYDYEYEYDNECEEYCGYDEYDYAEI